MRNFTERIFPALVIIVAVLGTIYVGYKLITNEPIFGITPQPVSAQSLVFDHSNCQYPERLTNPPDGCDNSDPARPECMKLGAEQCDLLSLDGSTPVLSPETQPVASQDVKTSNCKE